MELNRLDYVILKLLKKQNCKSYFESMTIHEIISITCTSRPATYKKMMKLMEYEYVAKGCKSTNADTFYITEKGLKLIENGGKKDD